MDGNELAVSMNLLNYPQEHTDPGTTMPKGAFYIRLWRENSLCDTKEWKGLRKRWRKEGYLKA